MKLGAHAIAAVLLALSACTSDDEGGVGPIADPPTPVPVQITNSGGATIQNGLCWSPDGAEVIYSANKGLHAVEVASKEVRTIYTDTSDQTRYLEHPSLQPNRQGLLFVRVLTGTTYTHDAYYYSIGAGSINQMTDCLYCVVSRTKWSPTGEEFAYVMGGGVWVENFATGSANAVVPVNSYVTSYCWSPDGSRIAYILDKRAIYTVAKEGGAASLVLDDIDQAWHIGWHPGGHRLAYVCCPDLANHELEAYLVAATGGEPVRYLADFEFDDSSFVFSPDGRYLATRRDGEIWVVPSGL
ncbi:MAG: PD40 domain-containing protein [bacterium]|nr:PD40 domain-containing protein [bacterium]